MQGNQNGQCGATTRLNCCCDSHSTTRRVSSKKHEHEHAGRHCCCCCCCYCYEASRGSEVGGKRSRGGAMTSSFCEVCGFAVHMKMGGLCFQIYLHPEIRVGRPKRCNTCAFSQKTILVWMAPQANSLDF